MADIRAAIADIRVAGPRRRSDQSAADAPRYGRCAELRAHTVVANIRGARPAPPESYLTSESRVILSESWAAGARGARAPRGGH